MKFRFSKQKVKKFFLIHLAVLLIGIVYIFAVGCPLHRIFGIPCPGCGMSRAWISFFMLDFKSAFKFHPLFIPITGILLYEIHREIVPKKLPKKVETVLLVLIVSAALILYFYRLFSGDPVVKIDFEQSVINKILEGGFW